MQCADRPPRRQFAEQQLIDRGGLPTLPKFSDDRGKLAEVSRSETTTGYGRTEVRRCWAFDAVDRLYQSRVCTGFAANNLTIVRHIVINLVRLNTSRKASIKTKRLLVATSDQFRAELPGIKV